VDIKKPAAPAADATPDATPVPTDTPAPVADAKPADPPKSPLDAVLAAQAVADKPAEPAPTADEPPAEPKPEDEPKPDADPAEPGEPADPTEDDLKKMGRGERKRIMQFMEQRNKALDQVRELEGPAQNWQKFNTFVEQSGLEHDDVVRTLSIAAWSRTDPVKAFEALRPIYDELAKLAGATGELPEDLAARVDKGAVDEDTARELAVERRRREALERSRQEEFQRSAAQAEEARVREVARTVASAVQAEETRLTRIDPDFVALKTEVHEQLEADLIRAHNRGEAPRTADAAAKFFRDTVSKVKQRYARFAPKPAAMTPDTGRSTPSEAVVTNPKSPLDVVMAVASGKKVEYSQEK
jgi:hypothetical protein